MPYAKYHRKEKEKERSLKRKESYKKKGYNPNSIENGFQKGHKLQSGNKHSNWQGGKSFESYGIEFNKKFKRAIRKRDNQICMICMIHREKLKRALDVHHIDYNKMLSIPQNCISLCNSCHMKTNYNRIHWTKMLQSVLSEKYGYQYSELREIIFKLNQDGGTK